MIKLAQENLAEIAQKTMRDYQIKEQRMELKR